MERPALQDFWLIFESLPECYVALDTNFHFINVTDSWVQTLDRSRNEVVGKYIFDIFPPHKGANSYEKDQVLPLVYFQKTLQERCLLQWPIFKYDILRPNKNKLEERYWGAISFPIINGNDEIVCILQRLEDVTEFAKFRGLASFTELQPIPISPKEMLLDVIQKATEIKGINNQLAMAQTLLEEKDVINAQLASIVSSSSDAIISYCEQGKILSWNKGAENLYGYTQREVLGKYISFLFTKAKVTEYKILPKELSNQKNISINRLDVYKKDGSVVPISVSFSAIFNNNGEIMGACSIARDITSSLKTEALIASQRESIKLLSTPVLQLKDELLLQPLVGAFDKERILVLRKELLRQINLKRAKVVVLDITGLLTIDEIVTKLLIDTIDAARLMGAAIIITGISNELANVMITLNIDLDKFIPVGDLQNGILMGEKIIAESKNVILEEQDFLGNSEELSDRNIAYDA